MAAGGIYYEQATGRQAGSLLRLRLHRSPSQPAGTCNLSLRAKLNSASAGGERELSVRSGSTGHMPLATCFDFSTQIQKKKHKRE